MKKIPVIFYPLVIVWLFLVFAFAACNPPQTQDMSLEGAYAYDDFHKPETCGACHQQIYADWQKSMMALSFVHKWDEVEYFQLALPHAQIPSDVSEVESGCVSCHGPLAFLAGDIPPPEPAEGGRVNEGVSCEICHSLTGSTEIDPFNFSAVMDVGVTKYGPRSDGQSSFHQIEYSEFLVSSSHCAVCHDEQSPYGAWVKETYREWQTSTYSQKKIRCQDCHMQFQPGLSAPDGIQRDDIARHTFDGVHSDLEFSKTIDVSVRTDRPEGRAGWTLTIYVDLQNGSCGHYFPSGASEERMLWLEVWVTDDKGESYHVPVKPKDFEGEEYTIADSTALAYQDIGRIMGLEGFEGLSRDGLVQDGARIFRRPFFNPEGEMTICQWYTAENNLVDYRIGPEQSIEEAYFIRIPDGLSYGKIFIEAVLYYSLVPSSIGNFFGLPPAEYEPVIIDRDSLIIDIVDWG